MTIKEEIERDIKTSIERLNLSKDIPEPQLAIPQKPEYGDLTTNFAFILAGAIKIPIKEAVSQLCSNLKSPLVEKKETISGFLNIWLKNERLHQEINKINKNEDFGRNKIGENKRVLIEFVSANPTGPLHIGHGRGAAYGDSIARILEFDGFSVEREYYVNNVGLQIEKLGASVRARYLGLKPPDDGYKGEYISQIALLIEKGKEGEPISFFSEFAYKIILSKIKDELSNFGVEFTNFEYENRLYDSGKVADVILLLKDNTYIKDGALWLKTSEISDEKDRVLVRGNEIPTYYTADLAYHKKKFERGYDLLIDLWGCDHHGYVERIRSGLSLLGCKEDLLKIILYQLVTIKKGGELISMSTREGEFVTLKEVMDEVGKDAARFFLLTKKSDTHLEFDLELAKKESPENPVYYIQYLHARACSILREAEKKKISLVQSPDYSLLVLKEEHRLMSYISLFPDEVKQAAIFLEPHRIANYLVSLAGIFHNYYHHYRVISDDISLTQARLSLINASRIVAKNGLNLLGISAPSVM